MQLSNVVYLSGVYDIVQGLQAAKAEGKSEDDIEGYSYVLDAFVSPDHFAGASQVSNKSITSPFSEVQAKGKHIILHSVNDEFVNKVQPVAFIEFFYGLKKPVVFHLDDYGLHHNILKFDKSIQLIDKIFIENS